MGQRAERGFVRWPRLLRQWEAVEEARSDLADEPSAGFGGGGGVFAAGDELAGHERVGVAGARVGELGREAEAEISPPRTIDLGAGADDGREQAAGTGAEANVVDGVGVSLFEGLPDVGEADVENAGSELGRERPPADGEVAPDA